MAGVDIAVWPRVGLAPHRVTHLIIHSEYLYFVCMVSNFFIDFRRLLSSGGKAGSVPPCPCLSGN